MSRVIVVTSGKGGVGKTSICAGISLALASHNFSVCLIDADLGLKNLDVILGVENRVIYDIADVYEGRVSIEKALVRDKKFFNLSLLPACKSISVERIDYSWTKKIINELRKQFDYIIIDSPAGIERGFYNAINSATEALVVTTLDIAAIRDADKVIGLLNASSINDVKLIINKVNPTSIATNASLSVEDALEVLSIPLVGVVYEDEQIRQLANAQIASTLTSGNAARCFESICRRMQGEEVPLTKYKKRGLLARLLS